MANEPITTIEQTRAGFAWQRVSRHLSERDFKSVAKGAPALVMSNGLIQSLLYLQDKGGASKAVCDELLAWLANRRLVPDASFSDQIRKLTELDGEKYMRATQEAVEMLKWIKQFASALVKG